MIYAFQKISLSNLRFHLQGSALIWEASSCSGSYRFVILEIYFLVKQGFF